MIAPAQLSVAVAVAAQAVTAAALKHCMVRAAEGTVITGGVLSLTVKVFVAEAALPQASEAEKVTVTVWVQLLAGAV